MNGIGTLNETARNMFRGPSGVAAYQQFASGGEAMGPPPTRGPDPQGIGAYQQFANGGDVVGEQTGEQTSVGRDVYLTSDGERVSEKSLTFEVDGIFVNVPSIQDGIQYSSDEVYEMMMNGEIQPTSAHKTEEEAISAAKARSDSLIKKFADGGPVYMSNGGDPFAEIDFDKLTAAVIQTESGGDPNAVSVDDAIGLMQVLPSTGAQPGYEQLGAQNVFDIAIDLGFPIDDSERTVEKARELLFEPEINVTFGTKYLRAMIAHSGGDIKQALQKYNTGTGNYQAFIEGRKPLDQEAVRYPILVANALTSLKSPSMASEAALDEAMYAADYLEPQTMPLMPPTTGEELRQGFRPRFGSPAQEDDYMSMVPQKISMRDKYSNENIAADLVGGEEALKEGIGGLTKSLNQPFVKPASKTLDRGSVPVQPFQKGVPDILRAGVAQRALRTPLSLTRKIKLPSGSVYEQGGAPRDDAKRYRDLGYADPRHSQAHSVTPNKRKIGYPKTSRLFRRNN